jgi:predicted dienelactone hydrolase
VNISVPIGRAIFLSALVLVLVACGGRDERPNRKEQSKENSVAVTPTATIAPIATIMPTIMITPTVTLSNPRPAPSATTVAATATRLVSASASTSTPVPVPSATRPPAIPTVLATGEYKTPNEYQAGVLQNYTVRDAKRNRSFQILVRYPIGAPSPLPLVVFSHGGGFNNAGHRSYDEWGIVLARAGYAVIHIAHAENALDAHCAVLKIPASECEPSDFRKEVSEGGSLLVLWYDRPRDASAVLDDLDNIERAANVKFDRNRIGAAGHSGGSHTVMSLAGALVDVSPSVHNLFSGDSRFKAFLNNSPQGIGHVGMTGNSWDKITAPVMIATGARDISEGEEAIARLDSFKAMRGPDKYLLYIDSPGANHSTFGLGDGGTDALKPIVAINGIAFFDAYLRGYPEAKAWLNSDGMSRWSTGIAKITAK